MPSYIAMLRGINIGPHKRVKMDKLRASFEDLGFDSVKTYIQSGNVVFKTSKSSAASLSKKIEKKLIEDFGFSVSVILRTRDEMETIIRDNPLLKEKGIDPSKLHVAFLSEAPSAGGAGKIAGAYPATGSGALFGQRTAFIFSQRNFGQQLVEASARPGVVGGDYDAELEHGESTSGDGKGIRLIHMGNDFRARAFAVKVFAAFLLVAPLLSCSRPPEPDTLVMIIESSPTNLDPRVGLDAQSENIDGLLFDNLLARDQHLGVAPGLAERWESPDPKTYIFHLRTRSKVFGRPAADFSRREVELRFPAARKSAQHESSDLPFRREH